MMCRALPVFCVLALSVLPSGNALAAWPTPGVPLHSATALFTGRTRMFPQGSDGVALFAITGLQDGSAYVEYRRFTSDGGELDVADFGSEHVFESAVTPGSAGDVYYAWSRDYSLGTNQNVYMNRILSDGSQDATWPSPGATIAAGTESEFNATTAPDDAGGAYVAWTEGANAVKVNRVQSDGALASGWPAGGLVLDQINHPAPGWTAPDGSGGAYVFWIRAPQNYIGPADIRLQRVTPTASIASGWPADGLLLGQVMALGPEYEFVYLLRSGLHDVIVTWFEVPYSGSTTGTIHVLRVHEDGTLSPGWSAGGFAVQIPVAGGHTTRTEVIPDTEGGAFVAWRTGDGVRATRVLADGTLAPGWSATGQSVLDAAAAFGDRYRIANGPQDGLVVIWEDLRHEGFRQLRARWLLGDGTSDPGEPDSGRVVSGPASVAYVFNAISDGAGGVYMLWEDRTGPDWVTQYLSHQPYTGTTDVAGTTTPGVLRMSPPRPNPARHTVAFTVTLPEDGGAQVEMIDLAGRRVRSLSLTGAGEHHIRLDDAGTLPVGVYFVRVSQGNRSVSDRIAIVH